MGENSPEEYVPEHRAEQEVEPVEAEESNVPKGLFSSRTYDRLKWVALVVIPLLGTLYYSLGELWDFPKVTEVVGTLAIIGTALGALLGLSSKKYNNDPARFAGKIAYTQELDDSGEPNVLMIPKQSPSAWEGKDEVTFKIEPR